MLKFSYWALASMIDMKKSDILLKIEEIKRLVDDRYISGCVHDSDWVNHFDTILERVREISQEIINEN